MGRPHRCAALFCSPGTMWLPHPASHSCRPAPPCRDAIGQRKKAAEAGEGKKKKKRRRDSDDEYAGAQGGDVNAGWVGGWAQSDAAVSTSQFGHLHEIWPVERRCGAAGGWRQCTGHRSWAESISPPCSPCRQQRRRRILRPHSQGHCWRRRLRQEGQGWRWRQAGGAARRGRRGRETVGHAARDRACSRRRLTPCPAATCRWRTPLPCVVRRRLCRRSLRGCGSSWRRRKRRRRRAVVARRWQQPPHRRTRSMHSCRVRRAVPAAAAAWPGWGSLACLPSFLSPPRTPPLLAPAIHTTRRRGGAA